MRFENMSNLSLDYFEGKYVIDKHIQKQKKEIINIKKDKKSL